MRPNLIFIMVDDLGYADLGCYGGRQAPFGPVSHLDGGDVETYKRMIHQMDKGLGWLVDALRRSGQLENTLIVFTSDTGAERFSDNRPLVGGGQPDPAHPTDGVSLESILRDPSRTFERPLYWRMNHRSQRALRPGDWKYLKVDDHEYLFKVANDARERDKLSGRQPERLEGVPADCLAWQTAVPAISEDAGVSLGQSYRDMSKC